jgi:hypothetical protein
MCNIWHYLQLAECGQYLVKVEVEIVLLGVVFGDPFQGTVFRPCTSSFFCDDLNIYLQRNPFNLHVCLFINVHVMYIAALLLTGR